MNSSQAIKYEHRITKIETSVRLGFEAIEGRFDTQEEMIKELKETLTLLVTQKNNAMNQMKGLLAIPIFLKRYHKEMLGILLMLIIVFNFIMNRVNL